MHYDLVILGAGICGLYHAYKFLKQNPNKTCCIIEKDNECGGRAKQIYFNDVLVPSGAGIGRYKKDKKLYKLIKELKLTSEIFSFKPNYHNIQPINIKEITQKLKNLYSNEQISFKEFALKHLGQKQYDDFLNTCGYTDFEKLHAYEALCNYGFDDVYGERKLFSVPWNDLIEKLVNNIKDKNGKIYVSTTIKEFSKNKILLDNNVNFTYSDYIITIPPAQINFKIDVPKNIFHQPFAYVYANITTPEFVEKFKTYTIVPRPLQKIIPFANNNFMVAYSDNDSALEIKNIKSKQELAGLIYKATKIKVSIINYKVIFREIGTHYRKEKYKRNKHFKGEAYALNQGWTNGGLK